MRNIKKNKKIKELVGREKRKAGFGSLNIITLGASYAHFNGVATYKRSTNYS